jgi:hypothetical protein
MGTEDISEELFYLNTDKTDNMRGFQHAYSLWKLQTVSIIDQLM